MDVDDCFTNVVGEFGRYQVLLCVLVSLYGFSLGGIAILPVFVAANVTELHQINQRVNNDSSILVEWDLQDQPWISDFIQAIYFSGFLAGVIIVGQLSDKFGRKIVMRIGYLALLPACLLLSFATSWKMFAIARFPVGFLGGGISLVMYIYVQECIGRQWWAFSSAFQGCFFPVGLMLFAVIAYFIPPWRLLIRTLSLLQIPPLIFIFTLSESARWLYSKKHHKEAEKVLGIFAKRNGVKNAVCHLKPLMLNRADNNPSLMSVLKNRIALKRLIVMSYVWFVTSFVYYALTFASGKLGSNLYFTLFLSAFLELVVHMFAPLVVNRKWCGRRPAVSYSLLAAGFACLILMGFDTKNKTIAMTVIGVTGRVSISFAFICIYTYSPELFPTHVRNVAVGSVSMFARVGGILSSFSKTFLSLRPMLGYFAFGFCGITAGLLVLLLPETYGKKPPDSFTDLKDEKFSSKNESFKFSKLKDYNEKNQLLESEEENVF